MTEEPSSNTRSVPEPIVRTLRRLIWRVRVVIVLRGVCAVVGTGAGVLLIAMAVDAQVVIFQNWVRWLLTLSALGVTAAVGVLLLVRPLGRSFTLPGIARGIESRHPELQERISSSVELLTSKDAPELRGSDTLIAALAREATLDARSVTPKREVTLRGVRPFLFAAGLALAIFTGLFVALPKKTTRLLGRAVAPYANIPNLFADDLKISPGRDITIPQGRSLSVKVRVVRSGVREAAFERVSSTGAKTVEQMTPLGSGEDSCPRFAITSPPAWESFRYRIRAGDAVSRYFNVTVVPPAVVNRITVRCDYPTYTAMGTKLQRGGDIHAVVGTVATITARTNKLVGDAEFLIDGVAIPHAKQEIAPGDRGEGVCAFKIALSEKLYGSWKLKLTDEHGFVSFSEEYGIDVSPDAAPIARIHHPENTHLVLKRDDRVPVFCSVSDDFGVEAAELLVAVDERKLTPIPVALTGAENKPGAVTTGKGLLDLSKMQLLGAGGVTFQLRAQDNRPPGLGGPQEDLSDVYTVQFDAKAEPYATQVVLAVELQIRELLTEALKHLEGARSVSEPLKARIAKVKLNLKLVTQIDLLRRHLTSAHVPLGELIQATSGGTYAAVGEAISGASGHVCDAEDLAAEIKLSDAAAERAELTRTSDFHVYRALTIVTEQLKKFDVMSQLLHRAQQLDDLARRQEELAQIRALLDRVNLLGSDQPKQGMSPEQWQNAQRGLTDKLGEMVQQIPGAMHAQVRTDERRSRNLAAEARLLGKQQGVLAKDTEMLGKIQQAERSLSDLGKRQVNLAKSASSSKHTAALGRTMGAAAKEIRSGALDKALSLLTQVDAGLREKIERLKQVQLAVQLTAEAQRIVTGQQTLAQNAASQQAAVTTQPATRPGETRPHVPALATAQKQIHTQLTELSKQAAGATPAFQKAFRNSNPLDVVASAREAIASDRADLAAAATAGAAKAMAALVKGLNEALEGDAELMRESDSLKKLSALANKQAELHRRIVEVARPLKKLRGTYRGREMKRFRREQTEISRLAAELTDRFKVLSPQADHIDAQAAMAALEGSEQIKAGETVKAAASAGIAAQKLGALVRRLSAENESRRDTGGRFRRGGKESNVAVRGSALQEPEQVLAELTGATRVKREFLVKDTEDLAARQRHLGSQMQAFAANLPKDVVADRQQDINERTVELANGVQLIREHAELLIRNPEGRKAARVAVSQIAKARRHQQRAQRMISIRAPGKAASPQRTAAAALEAAAKALERLGQLLSEEIDDLEPTEPEAQLAAAFEAADRAARSEKLSDVDLAAQLLDALARQAAAGAQRMGLSPWAADGILEAMIAGMSSMFGTGAMATDLSEAQLKAMGITYLDWARLPGTLRDEILRGPERSGPEEYRQLIKRYFQEIARRGGMEPKGKK